MTALLNAKDQKKMLDGLLMWLNSNMLHFCTPNEREFIGIHPEEIEPEITRKAFTELGLAIRFAQNSKKVCHHPVFIELKNKWIKNITDSSFFFDTKRRLRLFPHRTLAYATLRSLGIENKQVKHDLETVMSRNYMDRVERSAWDKLDMKYYTEIAQLPNDFPSYRRLFQDSILENLPSHSYAQNLDFYGLTHLIFHLSDFSKNDMKIIAGKKFEEIQEYIDATLCLCLIEQDWDLVQELLINQYCMRKTFTELDVYSASAIKDIQQPQGFIPGRNWVKNQHKDVNFDKNQHSFEDVYHPTILGLFLLILELKDTDE
ncbi:hypothetical protein LX97_03002 [Nonlabens dokdonensis]|uniref:DUF6895 domain-containing protein n=2 Tax=Nonlabens dokdonensis TaxID=328515 RepID=L7W902_NONDD|nr:hypothetical protein [Nonlabens dokdonensis]AGC78200.1 hypothetical protein DDD_3073 [Nonlabens dokdonensis DSW-6]PZX37907.1 hypothetical protein LX97_03002 [Nonlabens dokdonensis]